jgi:hypothetical protein
MPPLFLPALTHIPVRCMKHHNILRMTCGHLAESILVLLSTSPSMSSVDAWGGARAAVASPRSAGQASDRTCGLSLSGHVQTLIGSRSSLNSPKSLHTISSLLFTLCFSYNT